MTQTIQTSEILPLERYDAERPLIQKRVLFEKERRRIHLGPNLTFLFENAETLRYQVQEMLRIERRSSQEDIEHEVATYNEVLGSAGSLGCVLMIEIDDPAERDAKLRRWLDLPEKLFAVLEDGSRIAPTFDERQISDGRISSVHYIKFELGGRVPTALAVELADYSETITLSPDQRNALAEDLAD